MGLISNMFNYSKPGPGIEKEEQQKRRFFLFFELFFRKFFRGTGQYYGIRLNL